jgi:hypothetical protein
MRLRDSFSLIARAVVCGPLLFLSAIPALAQPARIGLVVGNSNYTALAALPGCQVSSRDLAKTLRGLGYQVVERQDVTSGGLAAAISEFSRGTELAPAASVFIYICGYAAGMNDRPFLLPVSASIRRPSDIMTQGMLAKALLDALVRGNPSRGLVALDVVPVPDVSAPDMGSLTDVPAPEGAGLIAVIESQPTPGPTALSVALGTGLTTPGAESGTLLADLKAALATHPSARVAALKMPTLSRPLAADDPPPPALPSPATELAEPAPMAARPTPSATDATPPVPALPDEGAMTDSERRRVQEALARIGYYAGRIDGRFGPETRAAIRRFQHEIGVETTGVITGEQAARLVTWK